MNHHLKTYGMLLVAGISIALIGCKKAEVAADEATAEAPTIAVSVAKARTKNMEETVSAQGVLQPVQGGSARVSAPFAARLQTISVREGDTVTKGQIIATLDARSQVAMAQSAAANFRASVSQSKQAQLAAEATARDQSSNLSIARLALTTALADRTAALQTAQTALELAQTDLAKTKAGARPEEIVQAEDALKQAEVTRTRAETEAKRQSFLFEKGVSARRQVDDATTALTVAESGVESAQQSLNLLKAGARTEDRVATQLRVRQAEEALKQARTSGDARVAQARAALQQAEQGTLQVAAKDQEAKAAIDTSKKAAADLSAAQVQAEYGAIRAPLSGVVVRRSLNPGDMADTTTTILEIANTQGLDLIANLPASEGSQIAVGMRSRVRQSDVPNAPPTEGRVTSVGQIDALTNLLPARIHIIPTRKGLTSGAFATAEIVVHTFPNVTVVPKEAIITREGKTILFVVDAQETAHAVPVSLGPAQNGLVVISGKVKAGDTVVTLGQFELADGGKVKVSTP